jgi:hypothetical protein
MTRISALTFRGRWLPKLLRLAAPQRRVAFHGINQAQHACGIAGLQVTAHYRHAVGNFSRWRLVRMSRHELCSRVQPACVNSFLSSSRLLQLLSFLIAESFAVTKYLAKVVVSTPLLSVRDRLVIRKLRPATPYN